MEIRLPSFKLPEPENKKRNLRVFFFFLIVLIVTGLCELSRIESQIHGQSLAIIQISHLILGLSILFLLSILIAVFLTFIVQRGLFVPRPGSLLDVLVRIWVDLAPPMVIQPIHNPVIEKECEDETQDQWLKEYSTLEIDEMLEFMMAKKGRGRKSYTPDDYRFHAVRDWNSMQMKGTSVRLQDFLDERFGYHHDGSPKVPKDTFYGWYRKFKIMLKEYRSTKIT